MPISPDKAAPQKIAKFGTIMDSQPKQIVILCPICQKQTVYSSSNRHRPFCSERCQIMDRANWASEAYRVPDRSFLDEDLIAGVPDCYKGSDA